MKRADATSQATPTHTSSESVSSKPAEDPNPDFRTVLKVMRFQLAVSIVLPILAGVALDTRRHAAPLWTIIGVIVAAGGVVTLYRHVLHTKFSTKEEDK